MKRSLVVTAVLSLAAILLIPTSGTAQTSSNDDRGFASTTARTTPTRDRGRPYTFTTRGRITPPSKLCAPGVDPTPGAGNCVPIDCPPGATNGIYCSRPGVRAICSGKVAVRFQKAGTTISTRLATVKPDCTFRSRVTFRTRLRTRLGRFTVRPRFQGNAVLNPKTGANRRVRAG